MFKKLLLGAALCLTSASTCWAQQPITCPTRPIGDNTNACASTAFVHNSGSGLVVLTTPITGGTNQGLLYNNGGLLGNLTTNNNAVFVTNGTGVPSATGTKTGNTTVFATSTGALTPGDCLKVDANSNIVDSGAGCGANANTPHTQDFVAGVGFTAGTTTALTLSSTPSSTDLLIIAFDGIWQNASTWSLTGAVVTFSAAIPLNTQVVEAKWSTSSTLAGVGSLNSLTGALNLVAGTGISITPSGSNITITNTSIAASGVTSFMGATGAVLGDSTLAISGQTVSIGNYTAPSTGVARTIVGRFAEWPYVTDYGAKCDGVTDDTTAIQTALNATPSGGTLMFPVGFCVIATSGVDNTLLLRTTPINLVGAGQFVSGLKAGASIGTNKNVLTFRPAASTFTLGYTVRDMTITTASTGSCVALMFDASAGGASNTNLTQIHIERTALQSFSACATPFAVYFNNANNNPNGAFFDVTISNSRIFGGIFLNQVGDTIRILDNLLTGPNAGVSGTQISGAGQLIIANNNITNTGGAVVIGCSLGMRITRNELEQSVASTEVNGSIVDLQGTACPMDHTTITENQIQAIAGIGTPILIRIAANNSNVKLDSNRLGTPTSYSGVVNASASLLCGNNEFATGAPHVSGTSPSAVWGNGC